MKTENIQMNKPGTLRDTVNFICDNERLARIAAAQRDQRRQDGLAGGMTYQQAEEFANG